MPDTVAKLTIGEASYEFPIFCPCPAVCFVNCLAVSILFILYFFSELRPFKTVT